MAVAVAVAVAVVMEEYIDRIAKKLATADSR